jgi:hypothetical protein
MKSPIGRGATLVLLALSFSFNVALVGYLARSGGLRRIFLRMDLAEPFKSRADFQKDPDARYRKFPNTPAEIVFAGVSLIAGGPWAEFYSDVHNRGIGGHGRLNGDPRASGPVRRRRRVSSGLATRGHAGATSRTLMIRMSRFAGASRMEAGLYFASTGGYSVLPGV